MAITDYATLQTAVLNWLNRSADADAIARCPEWIQLAEDELRTSLATNALREGETNNQAFSLAAEYTALPAGFIRSRGLTIQGQPDLPLDYVSPLTVDRYALLTGANGKPKKYTVQGNQLRLIPAPDATYTAVFSYQALASLSVSNTTNWLLTNYPKIYLFATLAEADRYYRDAEGGAADVALWNDLISKAFAAQGGSASGAALQMRPDNGSP